MESSFNNTVSGNNIASNNYGVRLYSSFNNTVSGNNITNNRYGVHLSSSSYNIISANTITNNSRGIYLFISSSNKLSGNNITNNGVDGVLLIESSNNTIFGNNIVSNSIGVSLDLSSNNTVFRNNITDNDYGVSLNSSFNNTIYHNTFISQIQQVYSNASANTWDDGYPSGGNYWSDYTGVDLYSGPYQNATGSDGIGDTPYVIDQNNQDNYPLAKPYPWDPHDIGITNVTKLDFIKQNLTLSINVTIFNYGVFTENFNVSVWEIQLEDLTPIYTLIQTKNITLARRNSTTIHFTWNTTGFATGKHRLKVEVIPVSGENDISDNWFYFWVLVAIKEDVTGDGKVNIDDLSEIGIRFGTLPEYTPPGALPYEPDFDINCDGKINIEDLSDVGNLFGYIYDP